MFASCARCVSMKVAVASFVVMLLLVACIATAERLCTSPHSPLEAASNRCDFADASNSRATINIQLNPRLQTTQQVAPLHAATYCSSSAFGKAMSKPSGGSRLEKLLGLLESALCLHAWPLAEGTSGDPLAAVARDPRCFADGSTPATRRAAGEQVANIVKAHPGQLPSIVRKVNLTSLCQYLLFCHMIPVCAQCCLCFGSRRAQVRHGLRSKHWDTRVAAGECLGLIAEHCEHHTAADLAKAATSADTVKADPDEHANGANPGGQAHGEDDAPLSFQNFRIEQVMEKGSLLLASGGTVGSATAVKEFAPVAKTSMDTLGPWSCLL